MGSDFVFEQFLGFECASSMLEFAGLNPLLAAPSSLSFYLLVVAGLASIAAVNQWMVTAIGAPFLLDPF